MSDFAPLMAGKKGLIMGVANDRSIAWAIAQDRPRPWRRTGVHLPGRSPAQGGSVPLAESIGCDILLQCDVTDRGQPRRRRSMRDPRSAGGRLDFVLHAIAFSDKEELKGRYIQTTPDNFALTMNVSCYSFTAVCPAGRKALMTEGRQPGGHPDLFRFRTRSCRTTT